MKGVTILLAGMMLAGCNLTTSTSVPSESPSIEGTIREVERSDRGPVILVESAAPVPGREPAARVTVPRTAGVLASGGGRVTQASAEDLAVGAEVRVWFTGPVAESLPVQATAGTVLILR